MQINEARQQPRVYTTNRATGPSMHLACAGLLDPLRFARCCVLQTQINTALQTDIEVSGCSHTVNNLVTRHWCDICRSGYSKHPNKQPWVLARVTGEPASAEPLQAITPANPPEAVVAAQVQAFRCAACGASESVLCWLASRQVPWK